MTAFAPAPAPAAAAANNPPPPPPPTWYDLALLPGSNGVATNRADPTRGYIRVFGQNATVQSYLVKLSAKFSRAYSVNVQFINLPHNYTLWWKSKTGRVNAQGVQGGDFFVYGHPRGRFTSIVKFIVHLHSMIMNVAPCPCGIC